MRQRRSPSEPLRSRVDRGFHGTRSALLVAVCVFVGRGAAGQNATTPSVAESIANEVRSVFEKSKKCVVRIEASDDHGQLSGSGFYVDPAGTIYTSYTIGGESSDIVVCSGEGKMPARRLFADRRSGVAVLKVDAETPFISIGSSKALQIGSPLVAIGYPMDLPVSPSFGTVAGFDIKYSSNRYFATRHIRSNIPVQRGEGGAPVVNMQGEAVGIVIATMDGSNACFTLPIEAAEKLRKDFIRFGELRPGWMGVGVEPANSQVAGSIAEISMLNVGSPGAKAGLRSGDRILQINDHSISSPEDVLNASFFIAAEDEVQIAVARGEERLEFHVIAGNRPATNARTAGDIPTLAPGSLDDLRGLPMKLDEGR
jgi:serine protease Do